MPNLTVLRDGAFLSNGLAADKGEALITFCEAEKYIDIINRNESISCVITRKDLSGSLALRLGVALAADPKVAFWQIHNWGVEKGMFSLGVEHFIAPSARIHSTAWIEEPCHIEADVEIGPGAVIFGHSIIMAEAKVGPGVVIGAEGLEYKRDGDRLFSVRHAGGVKIGSRVEIRANAVVGRHVFTTFTEIGSDTKIGPLANIGHGVVIGRRCLLAGNAMIGGSAKIGDDVWIGPSATIINGISIGDRSNIKVGAVVIENLPTDANVSGNFATNHLKRLKAYAAHRNQHS